jgi:hypothetical protein
MKTMDWAEEAWRAFVRAFAPMPPAIKRPAMENMAARVEAVARERELTVVGLGEVHAGCADVLAEKGELMLESLLDALRGEGYVVEDR